MKNMKDIILSEFIRAGYEKVEVDHVLFLKHKTNYDFWVCTESFELEYQHELFEKAIGLWKQYRESEKNISVLILKKVEHLSEEEIEWSIGVENDPLFFKKYVILFQETQCQMLKEIITSDQPLVSVLMQNAVFKHLKGEKENDGPYSLLYSIAHKLPFITLGVQRSEYKMDGYFFDTLEQQKLSDWLEQLPEGEEELKKMVVLSISK